MKIFTVTYLIKYKRNHNPVFGTKAIIIASNEQEAKEIYLKNHPYTPQDAMLKVNTISETFSAKEIYSF